MKYNVQVGSHAAQVDLNIDGKGGFTGDISHSDYGCGTFTNGVQVGETLTGNVVLSGHNATFTARISGPNISGRIGTHLSWPFGDVGQDFTGIQAP